MPHHSLFNWVVYLVWASGFLLTARAIGLALIGALADRRRLIADGRNGLTMIEAHRAIRLEAIRLAVAAIFTALGVWALMTSDGGGAPTLRGRVTLIGFLVLGALVCSQTWFDRADRKRELTPPTL